MRNTGGNGTYPKVEVQWLNQAVCFYQIYSWLTVKCQAIRHLSKLQPFNNKNSHL
jgi:hypothetical protein